jgi:hypothetical protein
MKNQAHKSEEVVVVVIDKELPRSRAMAEAFGDSGCKVVKVWKDKEDRLSVDGGGALPVQCLIRLWHVGNPYAECKGIRAELTVYYSGTGGEDRRTRPCPGGEIIWRPVPSETSGVLTRLEARALVAYASGVGPKPEFLSPPTPLEILPAMAILCQGYLATYAAHRIGEGALEVQEALRKMGWDAKRHAQLVKGEEKLTAVREPAWWLDTFELRPDGKWNEAQWKKFSDKLQAEWGRGEGLEELADLKSSLAEWGRAEGLEMQADLKSSQGKQGPPSVEAVAKAYVAIVRRLGGGATADRG